MKTILTGCAIAVLMTGAAAAQGRGGGLGGGLGGGVGGGIGVGAGGLGGGASAGGSIGLGAGFDRGPATTAPPIARGRSDTATTVRGAADVLPGTRASEQGRVNGSASTTNATGATVGAPSARAGLRRAATTDIRAGALVKSASGATIGRIESVTAATADTAAMVTVRSGDETWTLPQSEISASGDFLVTSRTRPAR